MSSWLCVRIFVLYLLERSSFIANSCTLVHWHCESRWAVVCSGKISGQQLSCCNKLEITTKISKVWVALVQVCWEILSYEYHMPSNYAERFYRMSIICRPSMLRDSIVWVYLPDVSLTANLFFHFLASLLTHLPPSLYSQFFNNPGLWSGLAINHLFPWLQVLMAIWNLKWCDLEKCHCNMNEELAQGAMPYQPSTMRE